MIVRPARIEDAEQMNEIHKKGWILAYSDVMSPETLERRNKNKTVESKRKFINSTEDSAKFYYVAEDNGKVVGICGGGKARDTNKGEFELYNLYILPEYLGKGVGKMLMKEAEEWFRENGGNEYHLFVLATNDLGREFYHRNGFKHIEENDIEDEEIGIEWFMKKEL